MYVNYTSFIDRTIRELTMEQKRHLSKAAAHVAKKMRQKVSDEYFEGDHSAPGEPPGKMTGNLKKGIGYKHEHPGEVLVGVGPPGYHAHLLEFGTVDRWITTKNGKKKYVGNVEPRPFVYPTLVEETAAVKRILSESWE